MTIAFDDNIPRRGPEIFVKRMKAGESKTLTVFGSKIRGMWIHWNAATGKSEPHYEKDCICETKPIGKRWKGFLHCFCQEDKQEVFLELTPTGAATIMQQIEHPEMLRGCYFRAKRSAAANGRMTVQILGQVPNVQVLPREKDPRHSILKLWGISEETLRRLFPDDGGETTDVEEGTDECL